MDPTRGLLFQQMANAQDLTTFYLAFKALENLERLIQQERLRQGQLSEMAHTRPGNVPSQPYGFAAPGVQEPPQNSVPRFQSEPSWDDAQDRMPWENQ